jgi:hypothetical protein
MLGPAALIDGRLARQVVLVVPTRYAFKLGWLERYELAAGRYTATMEDDEGVYFQSPEKVVVSILGLGTRTVDGGVYVARGHPDKATLYFDNGRDQLDERNLPRDFKYSLQ